MQFSNLPTKITTPFANSGSKRTIPIPSQIGITAGAASFTDGFPPLTFTPLASGGVPPAGQDFNGVLNAITLIQQWQSAGGGFVFDAAWASANGGYPKGAVLLRSDGTGQWINTTDNNSNDPDGASNPSGWVPLLQAGVTAITGLAASNVTLTNDQAGRSVITLAGTLTANVQIIFPTWAAEQWLIVNNTTGNFTVTAKTSAGTGVVVPQGSNTSVFGDGTNIIGSASGRFISRQVITSTQTITPPSGASFGNCIVVGGGGGGGGSAVTGASQVSAGAGGGGAGWAVKKIAAAALSGLTATVGAGGGGGVIAAGGNGGTSSIGALVTGVGGGGGNLGAAGTASNSLNGSGFAGTGTLGDYNFTGQVGQYAIYAANPLSGSGGSSFGGGGASWQIGGYVTGNSANGYGCGGSGGASVASQGGTTGGNGGPGVIIIDWYQ